MAKRHAHPVQFALLLAAMVMMAFVATSPVKAANGDAVILGTNNSSSAATSITDSGSSGLKATGFNTNGQFGLLGTTSNGTGYGVFGQMNGTGIGLVAEQLNKTKTGGGSALEVRGRIKLLGRSDVTATDDASVDGEETIAVSETTAYGITTGTIAFATISAPATVTLWIVGITMDPGSNNFRVKFNSPAANGTQIAWMLIEQ